MVSPAAPDGPPRKAGDPHCECRCDAFVRYGPAPVVFRQLMELHEMNENTSRVWCGECQTEWPCRTVELLYKFEGRSQ
jgi:hypothetical protein